MGKTWFWKITFAPEERSRESETLVVGFSSRKRTKTHNTSFIIYYSQWCIGDIDEKTQTYCSILSFHCCNWHHLAFVGCLLFLIGLLAFFCVFFVQRLVANKLPRVEFDSILYTVLVMNTTRKKTTNVQIFTTQIAQKIVKNKTRKNHFSNWWQIDIKMLQMNQHCLRIFVYVLNQYWYNCYSRRFETIWPGLFLRFFVLTVFFEYVFHQYWCICFCGWFETILTRFFYARFWQFFASFVISGICAFCLSTSLFLWLLFLTPDNVFFKWFIWATFKPSVQ